MNVTVCGLGYVGLPLALVMADNGACVTGYDIDKNKIDSLKSGNSFLNEKELITLWERNYETIQFCNELKFSDVYIIAVPTPLIKNQINCDFSYVRDVVNLIALNIKKDNFVILVSTSPVGSTKILAEIIEEKSGLKAGNDYYLAYCPERLYPGDTYNEIINNDHIIGGYTNKCIFKISEFYKKYISLNTQNTKSTIAELAKLSENAYRDVNIAFANELATIAHQNSEDVQEVISLANLHPRVNILQPGIGVGGHCLPIDPWFLIPTQQKAANSLIRSARNFNDNIPFILAGRIIKLILQKRVDSKSPKYDISILGYSYKPDSPDIRESPAIAIINEIRKHKFKVFAFDPLVDKNLDEIDVLNSLNNSLLTILLVEHESLKDICQKISYLHWKEIL